MSASTISAITLYAQKPIKLGDEIARKRKERDERDPREKHLPKLVTDHSACTGGSGGGGRRSPTERRPGGTAEEEEEEDTTAVATQQFVEALLGPRPNDLFEMFTPGVPYQEKRGGVVHNSLQLVEERYSRKHQRERQAELEAALVQLNCISVHQASSERDQLSGSKLPLRDHNLVAVRGARAWLASKQAESRASTVDATRKLIQEERAKTVALQENHQLARNASERYSNAGSSVGTNSSKPAATTNEPSHNLRVRPPRQAQPQQQSTTSHSPIDESFAAIDTGSSEASIQQRFHGKFFAGASTTTAGMKKSNKQRRLPTTQQPIAGGGGVAPNNNNNKLLTRRVLPQTPTPAHMGSYVGGGFELDPTAQLSATVTTLAQQHQICQSTPAQRSVSAPLTQGASGSVSLQPVVHAEGWDSTTTVPQGRTLRNGGPRGVVDSSKVSNSNSDSAGGNLTMVGGPSISTSTSVGGGNAPLLYPGEAPKAEVADVYEVLDTIHRKGVHAARPTNAVTQTICAAYLYGKQPSRTRQHVENATLLNRVIPPAITASTAWYYNAEAGDHYLAEMQEIRDRLKAQGIANRKLLLEVKAEDGANNKSMNTKSFRESGAGGRRSTAIGTTPPPTSAPATTTTTTTRRLEESISVRGGEDEERADDDPPPSTEKEENTAGGGRGGCKKKQHNPHGSKEGGVRRTSSSSEAGGAKAIVGVKSRSGTGNALSTATTRVATKKKLKKKDDDDLLPCDNSSNSPVDDTNTEAQPGEVSSGVTDAAPDHHTEEGQGLSSISTEEMKEDDRTPVSGPVVSDTINDEIGDVPTTENGSASENTPNEEHEVVFASSSLPHITAQDSPDDEVPTTAPTAAAAAVQDEEEKEDEQHQQSEGGDVEEKVDNDCHGEHQGASERLGLNGGDADDDSQGYSADDQTPSPSRGNTANGVGENQRVEDLEEEFVQEQEEGKGEEEEFPQGEFRHSRSSSGSEAADLNRENYDEAADQGTTTAPSPLVHSSTSEEQGLNDDDDSQGYSADDQTPSPSRGNTSTGIPVAEDEERGQGSSARDVEASIITPVVSPHSIVRGGGTSGGGSGRDERRKNRGLSMKLSPPPAAVISSNPPTTSIAEGPGSSSSSSDEDEDEQQYSSDDDDDEQSVQREDDGGADQLASMLAALKKPRSRSSNDDQAVGSGVGSEDTSGACIVSSRSNRTPRLRPELMEVPDHVLRMQQQAGQRSGSRGSRGSRPGSGSQGEVGVVAVAPATPLNPFERPAAAISRPDGAGGSRPTNGGGGRRGRGGGVAAGGDGVTTPRVEPSITSESLTRPSSRASVDQRSENASFFHTPSLRSAELTPTDQALLLSHRSSETDGDGGGRRKKSKQAKNKIDSSTRKDDKRKNKNKTELVRRGSGYSAIDSFAGSQRSRGSHFGGSEGKFSNSPGELLDAVGEAEVVGDAGFEEIPGLLGEDSLNAGGSSNRQMKRNKKKKKSNNRGEEQSDLMAPPDHEAEEDAFGNPTGGYDEDVFGDLDRGKKKKKKEKKTKREKFDDFE